MAEAGTGRQSTHRRHRTADVAPRSDRRIAISSRALRLAAALLALRSHRQRWFGDISEPAFNMLLDLFVEQGRGPAGATVASVARSSGAPTTTALRHLSELERRGMVVAQPDIHDRRCRRLHLAGHVAVDLSHCLEASISHRAVPGKLRKA